eukprot:gene10766-16582_t
MPPPRWGGRSPCAAWLLTLLLCHVHRADSAGVVASVTDITLQEGKSQDIELSLDTEPASMVYVILDTSSGDGQLDWGTSSVGGAIQIMWTKATWTQVRKLTVTAIDDTAAEGDVTYTIAG